MKAKHIVFVIFFSMYQRVNQCFSCMMGYISVLPWYVSQFFQNIRIFNFIKYLIHHYYFINNLILIFNPLKKYFKC